MEIKDIIRKRREELNLTYEQLGDMVGVGKSTVRKWETGMIENMRRDNIVALSKALNISPALIMGLEDENEEMAQFNTKLTEKETMLLENFNKLNDLGKEKIIEYSHDLIDTPKYTCSKNNVTELITATIDKHHYEEEMFSTIAAHDDNLTKDEKSEMDRRILETLRKRTK